MKFTYKCRRCGVSYEPIGCLGTIVRGSILLLKTVGEAGQNEPESLPLHDVHCCSEGGRGLADLIGFSTELAPVAQAESDDPPPQPRAIARGEVNPSAY